MLINRLTRVSLDKAFEELMGAFVEIEEALSHRIYSEVTEYSFKHYLFLLDKFQEVKMLKFRARRRPPANFFYVSTAQAHLSSYKTKLRNLLDEIKIEINGHEF